MGFGIWARLRFIVYLTISLAFMSTSGFTQTSDGGGNIKAPSSHLAEATPVVPRKLPGLRIKLVTSASHAPDFQQTTIMSGGNMLNDVGMVVNIVRCDQERIAQINPKNGTYMWQPIHRQPASQAASSAGTLNTSVDVQDTGERKQIFGLEARHLRTRSVLEPSSKACHVPRIDLTMDGWYIDVPGYDPKCAISPEMISSGINGCQTKTTMTGNGLALMGFPVEQVTKNGGMQMTTRATEVSLEYIDPEVFEVPAGLREVSSAGELWKMDTPAVPTAAPAAAPQSSKGGGGRGWKFLQALAGAAVQNLGSLDVNGNFSPTMGGVGLTHGSGAGFAKNLLGNFLQQAACDDPNAKALLGGLANGLNGQSPDQVLKGMVDGVVQQKTGTTLSAMVHDPTRATMEMQTKMLRDQQAQHAASNSQPAQDANSTPRTVPSAPTLAASSGQPAASSSVSSSSPFLPGAEDGTPRSAAPVDGVYATNNGYSIEVKFSPGKLTVIEPNRTSEYKQRLSSRVYDFDRNGILYSLQVMDDGSLRAFKPDSPQNFTTLGFVRGSAPAASAAAPQRGQISGGTKPANNSNADRTGAAGQPPQKDKEGSGSAPSTPQTQVKGLGADGVYVDRQKNYKIEVKFMPDKILVSEPNKTNSPYVQIPHTRIFKFDNPDTGKRYLLEVIDEETLKASVAGTDQVPTILKLERPAAGACKAPFSIRVKNPTAENPEEELLYGLRELPDSELQQTHNSRFSFVGRYQYEGNGHPDIVLTANGGGRFEVHGAPQNPEYIYELQGWWIQANCDGTPVREDHDIATRYYLILHLAREYEGMRYKRIGVNVRKDEDRIYILGERWKGKLAGGQ